MEGIALSALLGALTAGAGAWVVWGRKVMTKEEHADVCKLTQVPVVQKFGFLQQSQERTEKKVDKVADKVDKVLGVLHKMNGGEP